MRPPESGRDLERGFRLSLDENDTAGNASDDEPRIRALASPAAGLALWLCRLDGSSRTLSRYQRLLSESETARAARFGRDELRARYILGRGALRVLLGRRLGVEPERVPIVRGTRGRPQVPGATIDFNVSHTGNVALVGVLSGARVGVDIERSDRSINVDGIARRVLTPNERDAIARLDADAARRHVLTLWTCKEAMSKATGDALSAPFARLDVDLRNGAELRDGPGLYAPERWSLHRAAPIDDHIATVAIWRPG